MLVDLKDGDTIKSSFKEKQKLIPSAQVMVLYQILGLSEFWDIEEKSFKEIALKLNYSPMAISNAVDNLQTLGLITIAGEKEKYIQFNYDKVKLWEKIEENDFWNYPVFKRVYIDELPMGVKTWDCNTSALSEYSDVNQSRQNYVAIERREYNKLNKQNLFINANPTEGNYCLEVWKYNPEILSHTAIITELIVDPNINRGARSEVFVGSRKRCVAVFHWGRRIGDRPCGHVLRTSTGGVHQNEDLKGEYSQSRHEAPHRNLLETRLVFRLDLDPN
jgi:hypothetical protein